MLQNPKVQWRNNCIYMDYGVDQFTTTKLHFTDTNLLTFLVKSLTTLTTLDGNILENKFDYFMTVWKKKTL
jgi:hypothetical protein